MTGRLRRNVFATPSVRPPLVLGCLLLSALRFDTCLCGDGDGSANDEARGSPDKVHNPFAILLREDRKYLCSGAIVDVRWVISAAQCHNDGSRHLFAFAGVKDYGRPEKDRTEPSGLQVRRVALLRIHPRYARHRMRHDVMMGRTDTPWAFDDRVRAISIAGHQGFDQKSPSKARAVVLRKGDAVLSLLEVELSVSNVSECPGSWSTLQRRSMVCAATAGVSVCPHSAGGPLVSAVVGGGGGAALLGIVSAPRKRCRGEQEPAVFTFLPHYARWTRAVMAAREGCSSAPAAPRAAALPLVAALCLAGAA